MAEKETEQIAKTSLYFEKDNACKLEILKNKGMKLKIHEICNNAIIEHLKKLEEENPELFKGCQIE